MKQIPLQLRHKTERYHPGRSSMQAATSDPSKGRVRHQPAQRVRQGNIIACTATVYLPPVTH